MRSFLLLACLAAASVSLDQPGDQPGNPSSVQSASTPALQKPHRVLFIGNSLTYANDLPGLVQALAKEADMRVARVLRQAATR